MGIPTDLEVLRAGDVLSNESLDRIAAEGRQREFPAVTEDISVGELVEQRFGAEVVQRLVDPLLGGVYAGRAEHISVRAALPGLARQLTQLGGSLLHAARAIVAGAAREDDPRPVFRSVSGGLARLAEKLAELGEFTIRRNTTVRLIERTPDGYRLCLGAASSGEQLTADAVIVAVPAGKAAVMLHDIAPVAARELSGIETASVVIVTLALPMQAVAGLPSGSGILVPAIENTQIKAMTFSSQKWPDVGAESGVFLLRGSLGRAGEERALQYEDSELVSVLRHELVQITGVTANPIDSHVQRWGGGLPQYAVGHVERVEKIRALLGSLPGIAVCGASYEGVGIPACIDSAYRAADRVLTDLSADGE
jgi:oxygen-dependent protoporphyrinogen oxidase